MADLVKLSPSVVGGAVECNEDQTSDSSNSRVGRSVCWLIIISVLWLATRPYYGIVHDALFYMLQAIHELNPNRFAEDLYFKFGSQDEFTMFSIIYAPLLQLIGVANTAIVFAIVGQIFWICALLYFVRGLIRQRSLALMSVAAVIALPNTYVLLDYGEGFVTPRIFAEALTMAALGLLVRRRTGWAMAAFVASIAIHPLMTLSGLAFSSIYLMSKRPRWWIAIAAGARCMAIRYRPSAAHSRTPICLCCHSIRTRCRSAISYGYMLFLQPWREEFWRSLYSLGLVIAALGVMTYLLTPLMSQRRQIARLLPWLAGALVSLALIGWDARTPWTEFVESSQPIPKSLAEHIPRNASVYWEGGLEMLWLRMEQPSYFSCAQATEDLFFRDVALAYPSGCLRSSTAFARCH